MKSYELKPTYDNLLKTYLSDTISRNTDIFHFIEILDAVDDNCSIALDGNWGSGKTFFVKQVKMVMDAYNPYINITNEEDREKIKGLYNNQNLEENPQVCVYYDAWENDNDDDPILSLVYAILSNVETDFSFKNNPNCFKFAATLLEMFTGKEWDKVIESLKRDSPLSKLKNSKDIEETVKEFLDSLLLEKGNRLIIFIDELDRCKPSYAVRLLERIKHYFSNDRITFVFSINTSELQHTIKRYYGEDFNAGRYLDRFFDLRISLPPANLQKYYESLNFSDTHYIYDIVCGAVIKTFNFELREIAKYLRLTRVAAYDPTHNEDRYDFGFSDDRAIQFGLLYIIPIMIGLKIHDSKKYKDFINGKDHTPLVEVSNCLKIHFFENLLRSNETYDEKEKDKTLTSIEEKLKDVYEAIFITEYGRDIYNTVIGQYEFNKTTKDIILKTESLLSNYANMDMI